MKKPPTNIVVLVNTRNRDDLFEVAGELSDALNLLYKCLEFDVEITPSMEAYIDELLAQINTMNRYKAS